MAKVENENSSGTVKSSRQHPMVYVAAIIFLLLIITILAFFLYNPTEECPTADKKKIQFQLPDNNDYNTSIRIISRDEWNAEPPRNELTSLKIPIQRIIIAHTATTECKTKGECAFRVRSIEAFHIESRKFDDIAYNFLVGGDGNVYEGRGWDKQGAHTKGYNADSICIAFIGNFATIEPPEKQLKAAQLLLKDGIEIEKLRSDYELYGHRQLVATESPGDALYKIIQKWPHWKENQY